MSASPQSGMNSSVPPREAEALASETPISFGRTVVPAPCFNTESKTDNLLYEYAEHSFVGDAIMLSLKDDKKVPAKNHKFTLKNGLSVTYGQINGLAGDFYGTKEPISDGADARARSSRFQAAFDSLAEPRFRMPGEAESILDVLQAEVNAVNESLQHHTDPSFAYSTLADVSVKLQLLTTLRPLHIPSYAGLARINWDHFGADAHAAYNAGHALALEAAAFGELDKAYTLNAFADHYLEDSFSAGHLRTPRRILHSTLNPFADFCAKHMHDEDCAIGLQVKNRAGDSWTCYGDKRALDEVAADNIHRTVAAVQASANEVYTAYKTGKVIPAEQYAAWEIAPTLDSALGAQSLAPLFRYTDATQKTVEVRTDVKDRHHPQYKTTGWTYWGIDSDVKKSGWWDYPILMSGPAKVVPHTGLATVAIADAGVSRVYYQNPAGDVLEGNQQGGLWASDHHKVCIAARFSPLACVHTDDGDEVRLYYLDEKLKLCEYRFVKGKWYKGSLDTMNVECDRFTSIAAVRYEDGTGQSIRIYCQEKDSLHIQEFVFSSDKWSRGALLPSALSGTGIAALAYHLEGWRLRVYYQSDDLVLREHCLNIGENDDAWFAGNLNVGKAPGRTHIGALCETWRGVRLNVFWMNLASEITRAVQVNNTWHISTVVGPLPRTARFTPAQWAGGKHIRVYYQSDKYTVLEMCNDDGESRWTPGGQIAQE
ncbi:fungal fucose-specific lectin-domain-containing protein [Schizophyllum commune]